MLLDLSGASETNESSCLSPVVLISNRNSPNHGRCYYANVQSTIFGFVVVTAASIMGRQMGCSRVSVHCRM
jgi:hypothetical protein